MIDPAKFAAFAPRALPGTLAALQAAATKHGITEALPLAHWLGQMHVESAGFSKLSENLNYRAERLTQVWPSRFPNLAAAQPYANNPEALANKVYGGRMGNTQPGDGWRYRGSGLIQTTGRDNFRAAGHENDPDALRTDINVAADAAGHFFASRGCIAPAKADDVKAVTLKVNGGTNGLAERVTQTAAAKKVIA